jgi:acyl-CoA oxidase
MLGGHGYSRFSMMGEWRNNNDINITWEGDNTVLIQQAARFILKNLEKKMKGKEVKFKSLSFMKKFDEVSSAKLELSTPKDLYDLNNINTLLEFRVNLLLMKSIGRLAEKIGNKMKPFDAWNDTQTFYLQNMTKAFGELHTFNCFEGIYDFICFSSIGERYGLFEGK